MRGVTIAAPENDSANVGLKIDHHDVGRGVWTPAGDVVKYAVKYLLRVQRAGQRLNRVA